MKSDTSTYPFFKLDSDKYHEKIRSKGIECAHWYLMFSSDTGAQNWIKWWFENIMKEEYSRLKVPTTEVLKWKYAHFCFHTRILRSAILHMWIQLNM